MLALLATLACSDSVTAPERALVDFEYGVTRLAWEPPFVVERSDDSLVVRGFLWTPCAPYNASSVASVQSATLVVRVVGRATRECPQDVVGAVGYQATVSVPATSFSRLVVVHEWQDVNRPNETALDVTLSR